MTIERFRTLAVLGVVATVQKLFHSIEDMWCRMYITDKTRALKVCFARKVLETTTAISLKAWQVYMTPERRCSMVDK